MQSTKSADAAPAARGTSPELDRRYGKIGISAVAAAVRYQTGTQPQAPAVVLQFHQD